MRTASLAALTSLLASVVSVALVAACSSSTDSTLASSTKDSGTAVEVDARNPYPSFRDDVVPIVRESCALTACHSSKESNLGIFLAYDPVQIYAELKKTSPTSSQPFVVPGDVAKSYLVVKLEGKQAALASSCPSSNCGNVMPPDDPLPAAKIDTIKKWIADGAKND